eukprot:2774834-Rhodomonas_salina.1
MSGGQRQRMHLARLVLLHARVLDAHHDGRGGRGGHDADSHETRMVMMRHVISNDSAGGGSGGGEGWWWCEDTGWEGLADTGGSGDVRHGGGRLFVRDPEVVLLDEPTSALDDETCAKIVASLTTFLQGKTAIIVSHHRQTVVDKLCSVIHHVEGRLPSAHPQCHVLCLHETAPLASCLGVAGAETGSATGMLLGAAVH